MSDLFFQSSEIMALEGRIILTAIAISILCIFIFA